MIACCVRSLVLLPLFVLLSAAALAFSGEDVLLGKPWYHEEFSRRAALEAGFTAEAASTLAWHADYVDSYYCNPLWWAAGGVDRFKVSLATHDELVKLHFDDLFSAGQVQTNFHRFMSGTMAGLLWAREHNDVSAARNIVGASLHNMQDFYSHSCWVDDPVRRRHTWWETPVAERLARPLWTGAYELPVQLGVKPHGKFTPSSTVLNQPGITELMKLAALPFSPFCNHPIVQEWKQTRDGVAVQPDILGVHVPDNLIFLSPPGIAIDSKWVADIAVQQRGLQGTITGEQLFQQTYDLALRASVQWLGKIEAGMNAAGAGEFWQQVKTGPDSRREWEYEGYSRFPYQFITAGPYPPKPDAPEREYYLRVRLRTDKEAGSGTDADIYLLGDGKAYLLDYLPLAGVLIARNDFENGDQAVYTVGPFDRLPDSISLENRAADTGDVLSALGKDFMGAIDVAFADMGAFMMGIIAGNADLISTTKIVWSSEELARVTADGQPFTIDLNGGGEGHYRVQGAIRKVAEEDGAGLADRWAEFSVKLDHLECVKESTWDRGTDSDEPFLLSLLVPLPGEVSRHLVKPFTDVDTRERRTIGYTFPTVRIPAGNGMLCLPVSVMESDNESAKARGELLEAFSKKAEERTDPTRSEFVAALGAAIAADWKVGEIEVFAFTRGGQLSTGTVLDASPAQWIKAHQKAVFPLDAGKMRDWPITAAEMDAQVLNEADAP